MSLQKDAIPYTFIAKSVFFGQSIILMEKVLVDN